MANAPYGAAAAPAAAMLACALLAPLDARAADEAWRHSLAFYIWGAGLDGTAQIGPVASDVDASFSDILENMELAGMASWRAERGRLALTLDAMFVGLGGNGRGPLGAVVDVDVDQVIVSGDVAYELSPGFALLGGLRYVSLDNQLEVRGPAGGILSASRKEDWIDPYVGASGTWPLGADWSVTARGDLGGFGVGSDLTWHAVLRFNWSFSENGILTFGYRILDIDYEEGSGTGFFGYDMSQSGPVAGIVWRL